MASLFIKDGETAALAAEVAALRGVTKTVAVRDALMEARQAYIPQARKKTVAEALAWLDDYQKANPLPPKVTDADKAFFDRLWGEPED